MDTFVVLAGLGICCRVSVGLIVNDLVQPTEGREVVRLHKDLANPDPPDVLVFNRLRSQVLLEHLE